MILERRSRESLRGRGRDTGRRDAQHGHSDPLRDPTTGPFPYPTPLQRPLTTAPLPDLASPQGQRTSSNSSHASRFMTSRECAGSGRASSSKATSNQPAARATTANSCARPRRSVIARKTRGGDLWATHKALIVERNGSKRTGQKMQSAQITMSHAVVAILCGNDTVQSSEVTVTCGVAAFRFTSC